MIHRSQKKKELQTFMDKQASKRDFWKRRFSYYYQRLTECIRFHVPANSSVIEIGCGTGTLLNDLQPSRGVGIDLSKRMLDLAAEKYPHLEFIQMDAENLTMHEKFDYVIISDSIGYYEDVQKAFGELRKICHKDTRILINYYNFIWEPIFHFAEFFRLKMATKKSNWLGFNDLTNLLKLSSFEVIKVEKKILCPINIPVISEFFNKVLSNLPLFESFCTTNVVVAKLKEIPERRKDLESVSVIVPAMNEEGNIENAIKWMPRMGKHTEIIFVEGHSKDNTLDVIKKMSEKYAEKWDITYTVQDGKGKGDAVRKGFSMAKGDVLMILDADLTVHPQELIKFYDAISLSHGDYINGCRLVYPMEKQAMRFLNMCANHFFAVAFSWLLNQRIKDTLCGTKVISKVNWEKLIRNRSYFGDFDPFGDFDLIFGSAKLDLFFIEIPIRYRARTYGETNISRFRHGILLLEMVVYAMKRIKFI